jgi:tRNA threonylcarbamoyladenosine biosynthesis protein TsaB
MYLLINTSQPQAEIYLYKGEGKLAEDKWQAHRKLAETIHQRVDKLLSSKELNIKDISGIGIFKGPGSFTGLRIGHSVANALAYGLGVPIVGSLGDNWQADATARLVNGDNDQIVKPEYGAAARVTKPRK